MSQFETRRDQLRKALRKSGVDAMLVTNYTNVTYLTGFTGDDSYLLLTPKEAIVISDPRYTTQLEEECPGLELETREPGVPILESVSKLIKRCKAQKLGVESTSITMAVFQAIRDKLVGTELVGLSQAVEELRMIKDKEEIERIRRAGVQAARAIDVIRASLTPDMTERQVAADLEHQIRRFGGKGCSFPPIVAVGTRAALPHARPTERRIGEADFVLIDWGANEGLYASDLTRVYATGKISPKLQKIYRVVLQAQLAGIEAIRPGVSCEEVDKAARSVIVKAGYGPQFGHGLGHGIGLEVHEAPRLARNQQTVLRPGMVVTVEPGIYLPDWGGVRIEDDVLVTRTGYEVLTSVPKELEQCVIG